MNDQAVPPYPIEHSDPAIVVGAAEVEVIEREVDQARARFPGAAIVAVNDAALALAADHIVSLQEDALEDWLARQSVRFGTNPVVHCARLLPREVVGARPWIDHYWPRCNTKASSAIAAALVARAMGFRPVVLAAAPMDHTFDEKRRGTDIPHRHREALAEEVSSDRMIGIYSMSGVTRRVLGGPPNG